LHIDCKTHAWLYDAPMDSAPGPDGVESGIIADVESALQVFDRYLSIVTASDRRRPGRLDRAGYILLSQLESTTLAISDLSEIMGLDVSTINRRTASLMADRVIERIPDPAGGMARHFRITSQGRRLLASEREANRLGLRQMLVDWRAQDLSELARLLGQLNHSIEASSGLQLRRADPPPDITTPLPG
jgi:DNA-binding MarR family transcriptional regulator